MNPDWPLWIKKSLVKHFKAHFGESPAIKMFVEGEYRDTQFDKEFVEVRFDGPAVSHEPSNFYRLTITVNVLLSTTMDGDTYRHHRLAGRVLNGFTKRIPFFGEGEDAIECLQLKSKVRFNYFGQIDTVLKIEQSTVDADYTLSLAGS